MHRMGSDTHGPRKEDEDDHDWCPRLDRRLPYPCRDIARWRLRTVGFYNHSFVH